MQPLKVYCRKQAGRGCSEQGIGPIYLTPPHLQRGQGIGVFLEAYSAGFGP